MTHDAQSALRRVMEEYSSVTRFCMVCNYVTRIIEPLASRCAKFRFKPLPQRDMIRRLQFILQEETKLAQQSQEEGSSSSSSSSSSSGLVGENELSTLLELSNGDMRRAVTFLQTCFQFSGTLTADDLRELAGVRYHPFFLSISSILSFCLSLLSFLLDSSAFAHRRDLASHPEPFLLLRHHAGESGRLHLRRLLSFRHPEPTPYRTPPPLVSSVRPGQSQDCHPTCRSRSAAHGRCIGRAADASCLLVHDDYDPGNRVGGKRNGGGEEGGRRITQ